MTSPPDYGVAPPGYRLPDATHVGAVRLQVDGLDRSISYYQDLLGLQVLTSDAETATLGAGVGGLALVELRQRRGVRPVPQGGLLGLFHFAIVLPSREDLGRFVRHLRLRGARFLSADHCVSEAIYLWDPDGLGIEVYTDRPRHAWRTNGRELHMTTDPLDFQSLVDAGGVEPWRGMPGGTTMGHVHLNVGDVRQARALYSDALGLDVTVWSYPGALFMSAGGYHHHLGTNTWARGAHPASEDDARLLEWELVLPSSRDVEHAAASVHAAGYSLTADHTIADPWGTQVRLVQRD